MKKQWLLKEDPKEQRIVFQDLNPIIQEILQKKGLLSYEQMLEYLSEKPRETYDPYLLKNMDKAVDMILSAISNQKKLCIYGDYDVDGVSSVCLLMQFLSHLTDHIMYYIPSRFDEGYGLNKEALNTIKGQGADLVITVDCGTASYAEVEYAKQIGLDIIVTDHHNIGENPADCILINPKQKDCPYPFKDLCGCGVAFKLAQAIQRKINLPKSTVHSLLDLVALATVGDIVSLLGENRSLVKYGLEVINKKSRKGLEKLIQEVGLGDKKVKAYHIAYILAPHLNAGGRILTAELGLKLLLSDIDEEIKTSVTSLVENNRLRKRIQDEGFSKCDNIVQEKLSDDLFLVIDSEDVHEGIIGIVAGKIKEKYFRPTIIVTHSNEEGILKGTGRSIERIDIYAAIKKFENIFVKYGGHAGACGFKIEKNKMEELREKLNQEVNLFYQEDPEAFIDKIMIHAVIKINDLNQELIALLEKLEPTGYNNEKPIFMISDLSITKIVHLGKNNEHVKIFLKDEDNHHIEAIFFNEAARYSELLSVSNSIDIAGYPEMNHWNGTSKVQLNICDIRLSEAYAMNSNT